MTLNTHKHNAGFFSTCTVIIYNIIEYIEKNKKYPLKINGQNSFSWYKKDGETDTIFNDYFLDNTDPCMNYDFLTNIKDCFTDDSNEIQFCNFSKLRYNMINPIIKNYFSPSKDILERVQLLESKYSLDYENTCVLFYRGNDKATEMALCSYEDMYKIALQVQKENPVIKFLIQSDETEFIDYMIDKFPHSSLYFKNEIRHIKRSNTTVDIVYKHLNNEFSKNFLAITLCMSKCRNIICESGNCSLWIMLFRNNTNGVYQFLNGKWFNNI